MELSTECLDKVLVVAYTISKFECGHEKEIAREKDTLIAFNISLFCSLNLLFFSWRRFECARLS
jgi:hypothetical protein